MQLVIPIRAGKIAQWLGIIAVCLVMMSITVKILENAAGESESLLLANLVGLFNVNLEANLPSWFSSSLLLIAAALFGILAMVKRAHDESYWRRWTGLAVIFLYLSIDEAAAIHEFLTEPLQNALNTTGFLYFAWVIVGIIVVVVVGLAYLTFLLRLPSRIRDLFIIAGGLYVGGAVVIEAISANQWYLNDGSNLLYSMIGSLEELCEMLGVVVLLYALLLYIEQIQVTAQETVTLSLQKSVLVCLRNQLQGIRPALQAVKKTPLVIVFFGGLNLILVQWVLAREVTALLLGTELVVLLVSAAYFTGLSLGYLLSGRIRREWLMPLGIVTLVLHLTLPIWFRLLVAWLDSIGAYALAFLVLPLLTPFVISAFYSIFLPLFADDGQGSLVALYGLELFGSACGVLVLVVLGGLGLQAVYSIYAVGLLVILLGLRTKIRLLVPLVGASALWLVLLPSANDWSNALWYEALNGLPQGTKSLFTGYSPYQKVDALELPSGKRYLYLDGLNHFGTSDGSRLNVIMGQIPASLVKPQNAVVFGAGSMEMAAMIADYAGLVTTVEIDPLVVDVSERFFLPYNRMDVQTNRRVVVDDAKHFIANTDERFDFAATDLPAAYSIQTATLYSAPFFRAVADRLNLRGVVSVNLTSTFGPDDEISRRIAAGLLETFDDVMVVTPASAGWSFAYASDDMPFDRAAIEKALQDSGETNFVIFDTPAVRAFVGDAQPITLDSMDVVLKVSADWVSDRLRGG